MTGVLTGFAVLLVAVGVGYVLGRTRILGPDALTVLSRLVFHVLSPFLLFVVVGGADPAVLLSPTLVVSALAAVLVIGAFAAVARLCWRRPLGDTVIGALSAGYVNAGNIGIPISLYLLGNAAYPAPIMLLQLLVLMPITLVLLGPRGGWRAAILRTLRTPMLLGTAAGLVVALTGVSVPQIVWAPIDSVAQACVPIMLISYGISLAGTRVLTTRARLRDVALASGLNLFAMPLLAWVLAALVLRLPPEQVLVATTLAALPTAQNVFNYAHQFRVGEIVARDTIFVTTIGCLPVMLVVALLLGPA